MSDAVFALKLFSVTWQSTIKEENIVWEIPNKICVVFILIVIVELMKAFAR